MSRQTEICRAIANVLKETFGGIPGVTIAIEDACCPSEEIEKTLGRFGVLALVVASGHRRRPGTGANTDGDLSLSIVIVENPKRNRKSGVPGQTVTSVAEAAKDALHWRMVGDVHLVYEDMRRADVGEDDYRMEVTFVARRMSRAGTSATSARAEPEEIVEARVVALLSNALPGWDVIGALAPAPDGDTKRIPDTCVFVTADLSSQGLDWRGPGVPCEYTVRAEVRCSDADDGNGVVFRNTCRAVRAALEALIGDGCSGLDGDGFECDSFRLAPTSTDNGRTDNDSGMRKTYSATVMGRYSPHSTEEPTTTTTQEES